MTKSMTKSNNTGTGVSYLLGQMGPTEIWEESKVWILYSFIVFFQLWHIFDTFDNTKLKWIMKLTELLRKYLSGKDGILVIELQFTKEVCQ